MLPLVALLLPVQLLPGSRQHSIVLTSWIINKVEPFGVWGSKIKIFKESFNMGPLKRVAIMGAERETE